MQREQLLAKEAKYQTGVVKAQEYEDLLTAIRDNKENRVVKGINRSTWGRRISTTTRRTYPTDLSDPNEKSKQISLDNVNEVT